MTSVSHADYDRLLLGSPLRRRPVCIVICVALLAALSLATLIHLGLLASMRLDVVGVFCRALALSSVLAAAPLAVLWFLDRRERETQWLFAAAFLWGGFIATALALPFNTAFFALVDLWVAQHPIVSVVLGPDAAIMLAAPISAPIAEEIAKALGVLLIFWLLRAERRNSSRHPATRLSSSGSLPSFLTRRHGPMVHPELLSFAVSHACRRDARRRRESALRRNCQQWGIQALS